MPNSKQLSSSFVEATVHHRKGDFSRARSLYEEVLSNLPNHFDALHLLGVLESQTNDNVRAVELIGKAIQIKPDFADAYYNLGKALQGLGQNEAARQSYGIAISIQPDFSEAYNNLGNVLRDLKKLGDALQNFDKAIALKPDYAEAYYNRGIAFQELKLFDAAIQSYDQSITLRPNDAETYYNRGNAFRDTNRLVEAIQSYDKAIAIKPNDADAHYNRSLALLSNGDLNLGWKEYEWRWKAKNFPSPARNFTEPLWLGQESVSGKSVLLHAEQGLGDTLQFFRFVKLVSDLGAEVILEVQEPLAGLLSKIGVSARIVVMGNPLPSFDFHCPLLSLPLALNAAIDNIPAPMPYIFPEPESVAAWQARLGEKFLPRIGLAWNGNARHTNDHNRSISLEEFVALLPERLQYISFQKEVRDSDRAVLNERRDLLHFGEDLNSFSDTAALCALVDLVVSVDTSVAHLAAAMGKPVLLLLPYIPDWRWQLNRSDSPWYPTVKLFRQQCRESWLMPLQHVASELSARFGG